MAIPMTSKVAVAPGTLINEVGGESVILSVRNPFCCSLDEIGTRMWLVLAAADSIRDAYEQLLNEYDVDGTRLQTDFMNLITTLLEHQLVEVHRE